MILLMRKLKNSTLPILNKSKAKKMKEGHVSMGKNILLYKQPKDLIKKIDYVAEEKGLNRSQLIIQTLDKVFTEDPDFNEKKRLSELINDTHSMIAALEKEFKLSNVHQENILKVLLGE